MYSNAQITKAYRKANAENVKIIQWLIEQGVCASEIAGANYLNGPAGGFAKEAYRRAHVM